MNFSVDFDPSLQSADLIVQRTIYRLVQEALTNVLRHAQAAEVSVAGKQRNGRVRIEIIDDGIGLPTDYKPGRGVTGMRERVRALGGTFELSRDGGATRAVAELPLDPETLLPRTAY
jgi:two-component system sensor histidine kinase UhpB